MYFLFSFLQQTVPSSYNVARSIFKTRLFASRSIFLNQRLFAWYNFVFSLSYFFFPLLFYGIIMFVFFSPGFNSLGKSPVFIYTRRRARFFPVEWTRKKTDAFPFFSMAPDLMDPWRRDDSLEHKVVSSKGHQLSRFEEEQKKNSSKKNERKKMMETLLDLEEKKELIHELYASSIKWRLTWSPLLLPVFKRDE